MNVLILRRATAVLASIVLVAGLGFAGGEGEQTQGDEPLEFWARAAAEQRVAFEEALALFTEETGIEVDFPDVANLDFENALIRRASAGNLPDVVVNDTAFFGTLYNFGMLEEVDRDAIPHSSDINERAWDATLGPDGNYYAVPINSQAFAFFINAEWRENVGHDVPETFDDIRDLAVAFTEEDPDGNGEDDTVGFFFPGSTARGYAAWNFHHILWSFGGSYMDSTPDGFVPTFNSEESVAALQWLKDMVFEHGATNANIATAVTADINPAFRAQQGGIILTGPYMIPGFTQDGVPFEVVPVPAGPGQASAEVMAEGENAYVMRNTDRYEDALALAAFFSTEAGQRIGMASGPGRSTFVRIPVNSNVGVEQHDNTEAWEPFVPIYQESARYVPAVPQWFPFRLLISEYVNEAIASRDSDLEDIAQRLEQAIADELASQNVLAE